MKFSATSYFGFFGAFSRLERKRYGVTEMKRWFGIRHVRYFYLSWRLNRLIEFGRNHDLWFFAQESDLQFLEDVWSGKR
jgi:hypothetical protein